MIGNHRRAHSENLDLHSSIYDKFIILGNFSVEMGNPQIQSFCDDYSLRSLIKQPTCYKSPTNPTCINLILTKRPQSLQSTCVLETGLSDFHLMTLTVMKKTFKKLKHRIIIYRSYKHFSNKAFRKSLLNKLSKEVF